MFEYIQICSLCRQKLRLKNREQNKELSNTFNTCSLAWTLLLC